MSVSMVRELLAATWVIVFCSFHASAQIKVACIGNSITSGYSNTGYSYVPTLITLLGSGYTVVNYGVSGTTLMKKGNQPYWNTSAFREALASNADIITIKLGTNDSKTVNWNNSHKQFKEDYLALLDTLLVSNTGKPVIYLVLPAPIFNNPVANSWGMRDSVVINCIVPLIREIAADRGLTVVDAYTPLKQFGNYFTVDGVHPDRNAADSIAHFIYRAITEETQIKYSCIKPIKRQETRRVYSVFNGMNIPDFFADLTSGYRYELSVFSLNGVLIGKMPLLKSTGSRTQVKCMLDNTCGTGLVVVKPTEF